MGEGGREGRLEIVVLLQDGGGGVVMVLRRGWDDGGRREGNEFVLDLGCDFEDYRFWRKRGQEKVVDGWRCLFRLRK